MFKIRKTLILVEDTLQEGGRAIDPPLRKAAAVAVVSNPFAGRYEDDLSPMVEFSRELGQLLASKVVAALTLRATVDVESYGKAAIVGSEGEQEHAVAFLTTAFAEPFREAVGGGKAWIPSNTKRGGLGSSIDVPLAYKDALWVRSHYDTMEVRVPDAPRADEVVVAIAVAGGGRPNARLGGLRKEDVVGEDGLR